MPGGGSPSLSGIPRAVPETPPPAEAQPLDPLAGTGKLPSRSLTAFSEFSRSIRNREKARRRRTGRSPENYNMNYPSAFWSHVVDPDTTSPGSAAAKVDTALSEGGRVLLTEILLPRKSRQDRNCSTRTCLSKFNTDCKLEKPESTNSSSLRVSNHIAPPSALKDWRADAGKNSA